MFSCSSCFKRTTAPIAGLLVGANFSKNGSGEEDGLLRGQENVLMGGKEIEGNILEGVGNWGEWGCCW